MKFALIAIAAAVAALAVAPSEASAQNRGKRSVYAKKYVPYYARPASVQANGLCQRDTGTPTSQLNFRNRCDTEEFWNRTMQGGRRR